MKKILITGGNGFIGKNLAEELSAKYDISSPNRQVLDLLNQEEVENYLSSHAFDVVIHAANQNNTRRKETTDYEVLHNNLKMFCNLERCNRLFGKMYYFGSGAEYDREHYLPRMKEDYFGTYIPKDSYGFSKYMMHKLSEKSFNIYNLVLFGVYGKYEEWNRRFISNAICHNLLGLPIEIRRNVVFDYLYIKDLCKIMEWFVEHTPKYPCYNICRGEQIELRKLAELVNLASRKPSAIEISQSGLGMEYSGDNTRMREEMGEDRIEFTDFSVSVMELSKYYAENRKMINKNEL